MRSLILNGALILKKGRKNRTKGMQFTYKQHYLGAQFIKRFAGENNYVEVIRKKGLSKELKTPKDKIFCTEKCWDERTELGMKKIEDDFSNEVDKAINGSTDLNTKIINTYYWMWNVRGRLTDRKRTSPTFSNLKGEKLTNFQQDNIEKNGAIFIKEDGKMHDDMARGLFYQLELTKLLSLSDKNKKWGVLESPYQELICCDFFDYNPFSYSVSKFIIISPTMALLEGSEDGVITANDAEKMNDLSMRLCREFCIRRITP